MNRPSLRRRRKPNLLALAACLLLLFSIWHYITAPAYGSQLGARSLKLGNYENSRPADYFLSFNFATAGPLGSILVQFCSNDPLPGTACSAPAGFNANAAVLVTQTGETGFTISGASTANEIILTRPPLAAGIGPASYHFTGITNPSAPGSYFVRLQTFASSDASGPASDYGGIGFAIANELAINAVVPPYLLFCTAITITGLNCANASGDQVNFGELSTSQTRSGTSQMLVATNAELGYSITVDGTTLTSGNNVITALTANDVSRPGTQQFGFNLRANATPLIGNNPIGPGVSQPQANYNQPNIYHFAAGDVVVSHPQPDDVRQYTASYIANVPNGQAPGIYVTTLTYVCLANF